MNLETILSAMTLTAHTQDAYYQEWTKRFPEGIYHRRKRQYRAFRARILRMDAELDRCKRALSDIHSLGYDYDGYAGAKELEILIDEICTISTKALAGEEWWETEVTK